MNTNKSLKNKHGCKRGSSSFWMQNPNTLFEELKLKEDTIFLDLACGKGDYSIEALKYINNLGKIFAFDKNINSIDFLQDKIDKMGIKNISSVVVDITKKLPLQNDYIDICLIATALHAIPFYDFKNIFLELNRVLKNNGKIFVLECNKKSSDFGPPIQMRISNQELEEMLKNFGLVKTSYTNLEHNYLMQFKKIKHT